MLNTKDMSPDPDPADTAPERVTTITYNDITLAEVSSVNYLTTGGYQQNETIIFHVGRGLEHYGDYDAHDNAVGAVLRRFTDQGIAHDLLDRPSLLSIGESAIAAALLSARRAEYMQRRSCTNKLPSWRSDRRS